MSNEEPRKRGLPAIEQSREARRKIRWPSPKFWAWTGLILTATLILHWKRSQGEVESERNKLMARQRAVAAEFGPRWYPLRDKIEAWTLDLARTAEPEVIETEALKGWEFRDKPGLYLRLRVDEATSAEAIRKGAKDSLRDAFTACLLRANNPSPLAGAECKCTRDCPQGQFCNELDRCAPPAQPYNLRVAYRTLHVLSDEWVRDAQDASNDLRLRVLTASFDDTMRDDAPLAADLLTRAQYFLLVLDEKPEGPLDVPDGGKLGEAIQAVAHPARVGIWRLEDGKLMLRVRRDAAAELLGGTPTVDKETLDSRQRQANSCALALAVRQAMGDASAVAVPPPVAP